MCFPAKDAMTSGSPSAPDPNAPSAPAQANSPVRRRRTWAWAVIVLAAVVGGAAYFWWRSAAPAPTAMPGGRPDPSARALPVVAAASRKGSIDVYLNALGTVTPRNIVTVKPRVDGQLMRSRFARARS